MPRIRWPLGTRPNANAATASKDSESPNSESRVDAENIPAEAPPAKPSKKRKSTEAGSASSTTPAASKKTSTTSSTEATTDYPLTKKRKTAATTLKDAKTALKLAAASILDVSTIVQLEPDEEVPIYDTCDTIRRKIRTMLAKDGITQAAFLRAIVAAAYGESSTKKIQANSLNSFMKQKGPLAGNTSTVYYAAYVFFEKLRIKQHKPKSEDREIMEEIHPNGVDTKTQSGKIAYIGAANTVLKMDKYGRVGSFR